MKPAEWLTVTEAAAAQGVSEKTLRKRIKSGTVKAERVELSNGGWQWHVDPASLDTSNRSNLEGSNRVQPLPTDSGELSGEDVPTASNRVEELPTVPIPTVPTGPAVASDGSDLLREALEREREQVAFLRGVIEQQQRDAAELRAALREALRLSNRALPSPEATEAPTEPPEATQRATEAQPAQMVPTARQNPARRAVTPLQRLVLRLIGIRWRE